MSEWVCGTALSSVYYYWNLWWNSYVVELKIWISTFLCYNISALNEFLYSLCCIIRCTIHVGKPGLLNLVKYISTLWAVCLFEYLHAVFHLKALSHQRCCSRDRRFQRVSSFQEWTPEEPAFSQRVQKHLRKAGWSGWSNVLYNAVCTQEKICLIWGVNCSAWMCRKNGQWGPSL